MTIQEKVYIPLLEKFCSGIKDYHKKIDINSVFLANSMMNYEESTEKYFYIGRDTYGWHNFDQMIELCTSNKADEYININNKWLTPENIISHSSNNSGSFWTTVIKLHLYLSTNKIVKNVNNLTKDQIKLLKSIGWGNLNSIETTPAWEIINPDYYWDIKIKSKIFDKLKIILDIYKPKKIFIFNWCDNNKCDEYLENIDVEFDNKVYIQDIIAIYKIKNYDAKIYWTSHPNRFKWLKTNNDKIIQTIINVL